MTNKKKDGTTKILNFQRNRETLQRAAEKRLDNGEPLSALRLLNTYVKEYSPTTEICAMMADCFELLEANQSALKAWYAFLDVCTSDELPEAYEGLAVNYMNLGQEAQAAYYYNLLIHVDSTISQESKMEIVETFSRPKKSHLRFVYPPELADYTEELEKGITFLKEGDCHSARQVFEQVPKDTAQYKSAQNLIAITYLLSDQPEKTLSLCEELLKKDAEDVQANTTYAAVLRQLHREKEAVAVAKKLSEIPTEDTDERYKIATVCCENELHAEAFKIFTAIEKDIPNDKNLLYFKAVSAYKSGQTEQCISTFEKLLTIYPDAAVARYYYDALRYYQENREKEDLIAPDLNYFYLTPSQVRERYCELLFFLRKVRRDVAEDAADDEHLYNVMCWCFDEKDGMELELQSLAMEVAIHCGCRRFIRQKLLDPEVDILVKMIALQRLAQRNKVVSYGVVISQFYRKVQIPHIKIGVKKHKKFLQSYAVVLAKFIVVSEKYAQRICVSAEYLYNCLMVSNNVDLADQLNEISAAIYLLSGIKEGGGNLKSACSLFSAKEKETEMIVQFVQEITEKFHQKAELEKLKKQGEVQGESTQDL